MENKNEFELIDIGVRIFQEGVKIEKGIEASRAANRTDFRSARKIKYRRKLRKINTLIVLSENGYCPELATEELYNWRYKKVYPANEAFRDWLLTDEANKNNPYFFRALAVEKDLDLTNKSEKYKIGRAIYHIAQRRGFLSNRKEGTKESDGAVMSGIDEISKAKGSMTLGQYFYNLYEKGERIRGHYTHREDHYLDEFNRICKFQKVPNNIANKCRKAIFYQRPLKSQKGLIGNCPFEQNKPRCLVSHPAFEEFRMLCFINNIKIQAPADDKLRLLNIEEKTKIFNSFYRKSKPQFNFEEIAKQLTPKGIGYSFFKDRTRQKTDYSFNYSMKTTVSGCPTISQLKNIFGDDWQNQIHNNYVNKIKHKKEKSNIESVNDVWHVLFNFDKEEKLFEFALHKLNLNKEAAKKFSAIDLKQDYASLSLKAINKILPFLREGLIYSHAVFLAKLEDLIPANTWSDAENRNIIKTEIFNIIQSQNEEKQLTDILNGIIKTCREENITWSDNEFWQETIYNDLQNNLLSHFGKNRWNLFARGKQNELLDDLFFRFNKQMQLNLGKGQFAQTKRIDERIKEFIINNFSIAPDILTNMYHPSAINVYRQSQKSDDGKYYLNSPMISSIRNPMAMRALHQLRKVVNELIRENIIDRDTNVNIEMSRNLNNANYRKALQSWQNERAKQHNKNADRIKELYKESTGKEIVPTKTDILKYQLWEEQKHVCLYTGEKKIGIAEFIGPNPKYDIEHTIPRSKSLDNSQENLTLCNNKFNREIKRNKIPFELPGHKAILQRIDHWQKIIETANTGINKAQYNSRKTIDKVIKDKAIQKKHRLELERNYWQGKYNRFVMEDVPQGFKNSQLIDTGIITRYARLYVKTAFNNVYSVKGQIVADFRKFWGLQDFYEKKERTNHMHHCIDAVTIACITRDQYDIMAKFYHDWEKFHIAGKKDKPYMPKPWKSFTEDIKEITKEILVSHYTPDNLPKQSKKKLRKRGVIQYNKQGNPLYLTGDTARGCLHKEKNYGAIKKKEINKKGEIEDKIIYTIRKSVDSLEDSDLKNIIDDKVREIIKRGKKEESLINQKIESAEKRLQDSENSEEQYKIEVEIEQLNETKNRIYALPNKNGGFTPIKKVRTKATTVTNPLKIKKHRDLSKHAYKHHSCFVNDGNYIMAIYEGKDKNRKIKRDFELVNNLEAGEYFKSSNDKKTQGLALIPDFHLKTEYPLKCILKTGVMILVYKYFPNELWDLDNQEISKRLYKVIKMNKDGRVTLKLHSEARNDELLRQDYALMHNTKAPKSLTNGESYINFDNPFPKLLLSPSKFSFIVEGFDFKINVTGKLSIIK